VLSCIAYAQTVMFYWNRRNPKKIGRTESKRFSMPGKDATT